MMITLYNRLYKKDARFPQGVVPLIVNKEDVDWIQGLPIKLGAGSHPTAPTNPNDPKSQYESLARLVMRRHGIPVKDDAWIYRMDTEQPLNVSHENVCVPLEALTRHKIDNGVRTICLKDYLNVFSIHRPTQPESDPVLIPVVNIDTMTQAYLIGDEDDKDWLTGCLVRFNALGQPMINAEWDKWTSVMCEQARRMGVDNEKQPSIFRLKPDEPLDVRKYFVAIITKKELYTLHR